MVQSADIDSGGQYGIRDSLSSIISNPLFKGIVKNVVKGVFDSRGIPTVQTIPGAAQTDVLNAIGSVVTNPTFANAISDVNTFFSGQAPTSSSSAAVVATS